MGDRVHQGFTNRRPGQQVAVLAHQPLVGLEASKTEKPTYGPLHLLIEPTGRLCDLQHIGRPVVARIGDTLDAKVTRLRIALRIPAERHRTV